MGNLVSIFKSYFIKVTGYVDTLPHQAEVSSSKPPIPSSHSLSAYKIDIGYENSIVVPMVSLNRYSGFC